MSHDTPNMTEKELLTDLLNQEKELVKGYAGNITEARCKQLRQLLTNNLTECSEDQFQLFDQMQQRNMHTAKDATRQAVQTAKQNMQQLRQQTGM